MSNIQRLVQLAARKDIRNFEKTFQNELSAKLAERIDTKRKAVAASMFNEEVDIQNKAGDTVSTSRNFKEDAKKN